MKILIPGFRTILTLLAKHNVDFLIVGGYAVIFHGYARTTNDLDIWLKSSSTNKDKLINALNEYGIEEQDLNELASLNLEKEKFFFIGQKPERVDFLMQLNHVNFDDAEKKAKHFQLEGMKIPVIDLEDLILSKITNVGPKDKADVDMLQKINRQKDSK